MKIYINDDPGITLTYFTPRSNLEVILKRVKLAANDQNLQKISVFEKTLTQGVVYPFHRAIYMYMTIIFKHLL